MKLNSFIEMHVKESDRHAIDKEFLCQSKTRYISYFALIRKTVEGMDGTLRSTISIELNEN